MNHCRKIQIVSLSKGTIGESFVKHEVDLGIKRLKEFGLEVSFGKNALKGIDFLQKNPQARAQDLLDAFKDETVDMILCAIGGDDTYRLLPYLFDNNELQNAVNNKIFLGFSDSTMNHLMLNKVGLNTFYGQSFLADVCEIENDMLPYSKHYFKELIETGTISKITPSDIWYEERTDWDVPIGTKRTSHPNKDFELLQGPALFSGKILGGCVDTLYDIFDNTRYKDSVELCSKYRLFPSLEDWKGKILLLETSEECPSPEKYTTLIDKFSALGIFDVINGIIAGKPLDEKYYEEYKAILKNRIKNKNLPILFNVNIGHATPRCIIPFGKTATVDSEQQTISFN